MERTFDYNDAISYIHGTLRFGSRPGLERISVLMERLGNPQDKLNFIHVAGTNGKGSTTAMTASVLMAAGYKTGMFISPYLEDFCERIQTDGEYIPENELARLTLVVKTEIEAMISAGHEHPTEFEIITAIAMLWFYEKRCEYVALEVGLGGAIDSTNVIKRPAVAVITSISIDHTEYLGSTLEAITQVKCGIIKEGGIVVTSDGQPDAVLEIIRHNCAAKKCELIIPDTHELEIISSDLSASTVLYKGLKLKIPLLGAHQIKNALTCVECARALNGQKITDTHIAAGIEAVKWPGRLEIIRERPLCIIDAAHNVEGVNVLAAAIDTLLRGRRVITVMGMLKDKDYRNCIPEIAKRSAVFIAATPLGVRALGSEITAEIAGAHCDTVINVGDIQNAVNIALREAREDDAVLMCGSLMLIGEAKKVLRRG